MYVLAPGPDDGNVSAPTNHAFRLLTQELQSLVDQKQLFDTRSEALH